MEYSICVVLGRRFNVHKAGEMNIVICSLVRS